MKRGGKYSLSKRLFETTKNRNNKKYSLTRLFEVVQDRTIRKQSLAVDATIGHGQIYELGSSDAVGKKGAKRASKYRAYIEKEDISNTGTYYDKKSIKLFPVEDSESLRLVFQTLESGNNFSLSHSLAGQSGSTASDDDYVERVWIAGRFKVLSTFGEGEDQETELDDLDVSRRYSQLSDGIVLLPQANLQQLEEVTEDSLGVTDAQQKEVEDKWNALDSSKQAEITGLLSPSGQMISWTKAMERIYGADDVNWPVKENEIGGKKPPKGEAPGLFATTEGDGGRGEILAGAIFPNLVVIGAAGKEAGIDLFDVISRQKIEVKEAGNFRIGTKSRQTASTVIDLIKNALSELKPPMEAKWAEIQGITRQELVAAMPPVPTGGINDYFEGEPWKDFVGNFSGCTACPESAYESLSIQLQKLKKAAHGPTPDESKQDRAFGLAMKKINSIYDLVIKSLDKDINYAFSGELTAARAESTTAYFNIIKIDSSSLQSPIYDGATGDDGTVNLDTITSNIKKAYMDALNPEAAFAGTDIMVVSPKGYVMYTGAQIAAKLRAAAETAADGADPVAASASGTFTQGTIQLTIDITKEMEKVFTDTLSTDLGTDVVITDEDGIEVT